MHCTTYQRYTNTIGWLGRSKRNHREVTYSIVQNVGKVTVAVLVDEGGERKSVGLDAAVERVVARVDAADTTPPLEEGLTGRRAYALDVVRKRVRLRSAAPVEPYVKGWRMSHICCGRVSRLSSCDTDTFRDVGTMQRLAPPRTGARRAGQAV